MEAPETATIWWPRSSSSSITPMCANPRAPPEPSDSAIFMVPVCPVAPGKISISSRSVLRQHPLMLCRCDARKGSVSRTVLLQRGHLHTTAPHYFRISTSGVVPAWFPLGCREDIRCEAAGDKRNQPEESDLVGAEA